MCCTAASDPTIFTLSIHGAGNFPYRKERGDLDVALPDGTGDAAYRGALERYLPQALAAARPDLAIYLAGADPFDNRVGRRCMTDHPVTPLAPWPLCPFANTYVNPNGFQGQQIYAQAFPHFVKSTTWRADPIVV